MRAAQRREAELHELIAAGGIKAIHASRWHCQIGPMHLWLASGRWLNAETGATWQNQSNVAARIVRAILLNPAAVTAERVRREGFEVAGATAKKSIRPLWAQLH